MKKIIKMSGITAGIIVVIAYLSFLFILPNAVDLNNYKADVQKIVKEQTNLSLDFDNPKISVTPFLAAGITANNITVKLPDDSELLKADSFKGRISLPSLLLLTVKVSTAEITNPVINIDIIDGKAFKAVQAYEVILNKNEENIAKNLQSAQKPLIDPALIKIMVPAVKIYNYTAFVNDLKTGNFLKLRGDELVLGYKNGKTASVKTIAELYLNETKNITADINIDTVLPKPTVLDKEDDKAQRVEIPFVNPVTMYMAYDLKTNINSKIKVREKNNIYTSNGYFNVDNFTIKLADLQLPESRFHLKTRGTKADIDSDLYITKDDKLSLLGMLNYGKKPSMDMKINSTQIGVDDVITLVKATLDSLHIKHELAPIKGDGYFLADTYIKTNFKKLNSEGSITIKDCVIKDSVKNIVIAKINSIISMDNSILKFIDTSVEIADTIFKVDGSIDETSKADISVLMEKMPLEKVFALFLPSEINNVYKVNSGYIDLILNLKGELKNAIGNIKLSLHNLSMTDKVNKINYLNNLLVADFSSNFKSYRGEIKNSDFKLTMNGASVYNDSFTLTIDDKDITVAPAKIMINNSAAIDINGNIKDYAKNPIFNFDVNGKLITKDLKQFFGQDLDIFIKEKGVIPFILNINGDRKKQTLTASLEADGDNYITPVDIDNVKNKRTLLQTVIDFKGDRLKIKDTGFYIKNILPDPKNPEKTIVELDEILSIDGTITKINTASPNINLIKVKMPSEIFASICAFPQSKLTAKGSMFIFGDLKAPRMRGEFNIWKLSIPELFIAMDKAAAKFEGKDLDVDIKNLNANGSDYNILINADLNPSKYFTIKNLNLISNLTDVDMLMKVSEAAMSYMPAAQESSEPASNNAAAIIPVQIKDGNIDIKSIKTGNINLTETTGKLSLFENVVYINNLITNGFKGKIKGDVSANIVTSEVKAVLKGSGLDVEQTLLDAANMKDTLTGTMDFDTDISLKGATYEEQMKTLKGNVNFTMRNGQLGPFGRLENLIMAENIRESAFFQSAVGSVLNSLLSFNTSHYNVLKGKLNFENGITEINSITSSGDIMSAYIFGNFDLLKNNIDIKLRGKLGSQVSDSLGPISLVNPINLVKATPGMGLVMGKIFFLFCEQVTPDELALIPELGKDISDTNATKFQVIIRGDVAKPLSLVKSFKWLALESEINAAKEYLNSIPEGTVPDEILNITTTDPETLKTEIKEEAKNKIRETVSESLSDETKEKIEQNKNTFSKIKSLFGKKDTAVEDETAIDAEQIIQQKTQQALKDILMPQQQIPQQPETNNITN